MTTQAILQQMTHTWFNGGWVMLALFFVALIAYASAIHLMFLIHHPGLAGATDEDIRKWVADPPNAPKAFRELLRYTQDEVTSLADIEGRFREVEAAKVPEVDRRLAFLNIIVVSAPLFGLLGTVLGMLLTFKAIGVGGSSTSDVIAKGISEALVATQTGMMVAIPGLLMAHVVKRRRHEYVAFLARLEGITLRYFRPQFRGMTSFFVRKNTDRAASPAVPSSDSRAPVTANSLDSKGEAPPGGKTGDVPPSHIGASPKKQTQDSVSRPVFGTPDPAL